MAITITKQPVYELAVRLGGKIELEVAIDDEAGATYKWFTASQKEAIDGQTTKKLTIDNATDKDFGVYWVEVTKGDTKILSLKSIIRMDTSKPKVEFTKQPTNQSIDPDGTLTVEVTATTDDPLNPVQYEWVHNSRTFSVTQTGTLTVEHATNDLSGSWFCIARSGSEIAVSDTFTVTVSNKPFVRVTEQPENLVAAGNTEATFSSSATSNYPEKIVYQWYKGDAPIDTVANPTAATPNLVVKRITQADNAATYKCRAQVLAFGDYAQVYADSNPATITVNADFDIVECAAPASQAGVRPGAIITLESNVSNNDGRYLFAYQWKKDGIAILGATDPTYEFVCGADSAGNYAYTAYSGPDNSVSKTSADAVITVDKTEATITISKQPSAVNLASGVPFVLSVTATTNDPGGLYYEWQKNNIAILGANSAELIFESPSPLDTGNYTCILYTEPMDADWASTKRTDNAVVSITDGKEITVAITTQPVGGAKTLNEAAKLSVTATTTGYPLKYEWYFNDALVSKTDYNNIQFYVNEKTAGRYKVIAKSGGVTKASDEVVVSVSPHDKVRITKQPKPVIWKVLSEVDKNKTTLVAGGEAIGTAAGMVPEYKWYKVGTAEAIVGAATAEYEVTGITSNTADQYYCAIKVDTQTVFTKPVWVIGTDAEMTKYVHPLPSRNSSFMWKGYWVTDVIEEAIATGRNWVQQYQVLKYSDDIESIVAAMAAYGVSEVMESRDGYVLKFNTAPESWS